MRWRFTEGLFGFLGSAARPSSSFSSLSLDPGMDDDDDDDIGPDLNPLLSSIALSVLCRCSEILCLSIEELQRSFKTDIPIHVRQHSMYTKNLVEYCCFKALQVASKRPDYLADKEFRLLTYDMMLAWEAPDTESESLLNETARFKHTDVDEDDGSLFYISAVSMAIQVDYKKTVGLGAFARIAPACPPIADPITVHNLFEALTFSSGGQLHFLIYDKYLKSLHKVLKSARSISVPRLNAKLNLAEGEMILDIDGTVATKPILQHIGISTWPGRLTLTNQALYFEPLGVGSHDKPITYDLATDLKQVIKRESTGPWGARLFDKAIMYKSNILPDAILLEFPELIGHSRRDYWYAIIREILHVHKFIRKYNLKQLQQAEALSKAALGIFRYRAVRDAFHIIPSHFKSTLSFSLTEKLPKGDRILEALYSHLELLSTESKDDESDEEGNDTSPISLYALIRIGFVSLKRKDWPEETDIFVRDLRVGETSPLEKAVQKSVCYSGKVDAARATLDQIKVGDIETNVAVMTELLFPLVEFGKLLLSLVKWEDPFKSTVFLLSTIYTVYRGWIKYIIPSVFLSLALLMLWHKNHRKGKQMEPFQITPPSRSPVEMLLSLQDAVSQLETKVQAGCIFLLKLRAILFAAYPKTTGKHAMALTVIAAVFAIVPFKYVVFFLFLEGYTRLMPLRKESSLKFHRRLREWWVRIPAAPVQLIKHYDTMLSGLGRVRVWGHPKISSNQQSGEGLSVICKSTNTCIART